MKAALLKISKNPFRLILLAVIVKFPMFFTKHIQEDSFITWRVAKNLVQYGVIGFNGEERISASTTHFYVFLSALFNLIFGEYFIYPLLIFSCFLFAVGSWWLGKILFPENSFRRSFFVILLNLTPPALTASVLGMEYGILFFLYSGLLYFGLSKGKKWAFLIFPILILWTRLDAVVFLGIFFLADLYQNRKINYALIIGGIMSLASVLFFNEIYFGEIINHTITAKKIAYKNLMQDNSWQFLTYQWAYYGGLIKKFSVITLIVFLSFLSFLIYVVRAILIDEKVERKVKVVVVFCVVFALAKITFFSFFRAYFDWYYWLPRVFLFVVVLYYFLNLKNGNLKIRYGGLFIFFVGLYLFQWVQSYAIGYMEERQRMQITSDIKSENVDLRKSILLEPAGIIPFYTGLYTYDEVGLVNKRINDEMLKDEKYWWINSVKRFQPNYILTISEQPALEKGFYKLKASDMDTFKSNYVLMKKYPISRIHEDAPQFLRWIYKIRPIGKDYFLFKKTSAQP